MAPVSCAGGTGQLRPVRAHFLRHILERELQCNYNYSMGALHFEWDEKKAAANLKKHGVSFEEARSVFYEDSIGYFKSLSEEVGIPYQSLINLYLRDCVASQRKLNLNWK